MNDTLKAIVDVLHTGTPELKVAAAQVLGELGPKEPAVTKGLADQLTSGDPTLNRYLLQALSQIGTPAAVTVLVSRLDEGGRDGELVTHLLSRGDAAIVKPLAKAYQSAESHLRQPLMHILGRHTEPEAMTVLRQALLSEDPAASTQAADFLGRRTKELTEARRAAFGKALQKDINGKELPPEALANALGLLRQLDGQDSRATLLKFASDKQPDVVRAAALDGLQGIELTQAQAGTLLDYMAESEPGSSVVEAVVHALQDHESWSTKCVTQLKQMVGSRREETKLFAMRALRNTATEQTAKLFLGYLHHANSSYREVAREGLGNNVKALPTLLRSFNLEKDLHKAQTVAAPLRELASKVKPTQLKSMCEKTAKLLGVGDPLGEVHLELCLAVDAELASSELVDKAVRLRRARKLTEALAILLHLARGEHLDLEGRYQMALARLLMDHEEGRSGMTNHTGDATMGYIAGLVRDGFAVFDRLKKESMLEPEDLLRVGRHFNNGIGPERRFGTDLLRFVADKHAKVRAGEEARQMIRTEGLA